MSSLSAALNSSNHLNIDDVAFWDRVAAHFREKLGRMASTASANTAKQTAFNARVAAVKSPKRYDRTLLSQSLPTLPIPWHIMMNAILGISLSN